MPVQKAREGNTVEGAEQDDLDRLSQINATTIPYWYPTTRLVWNSRINVPKDMTIVDLFTGVGPFAILIAKTHKNVKIVAIDINPHAIKLLKRNIKVNKVGSKVFPFLGDANQIVKHKFCGVGSRSRN